MLITFEGLDGSGKTTIIAKVSELLKEKNIPFETVKWSQKHTPIDIFRDVLKSPSAMLEALTFSLDRRVFIEESIKPALLAKKVVICDRYVDSTIAYQGHGRNLGLIQTLELQRLIAGDHWPDLTIYLAIGIETINVRMQNRNNGPMDHFESENKDFFGRVYEGYEILGKLFPDRIKKVDAEQAQERVLSEVKALIADALKIKL